jgi:HopA1 effector protein family
MSAFTEQLRTIVSAVEMLSAERARVASARGERREVAVANERGPFLGLAETLYADYYSALPDAAPGTSAIAPEAFLAQLSAANAVAPRYGTMREMVTSPYGHYVFFGRGVHDAATGRQVRFYWNVRPEGAAAFVREVSARLDRRRIPFQAKVPVLPQGYARTDAGVLYLGDEDVAAASDAIAAVYRALRGAMRAHVPYFTRLLAPGLAFAESPPTRDSFGMHRCDLIAEGLVWGAQRAAADFEERLTVVRERLTKYGFDLDALERNPTSRYPYPLDAIAAEAA